MINEFWTKCCEAHVILLLTNLYKTYTIYTYKECK